MSSVARVKFIKTKVIFRYHTKGVSNQVSSYSDHEKLKVSYVQILVPKWEKNKKVGKIFWITKRRSRGITNRGRFLGLQIGVRGITNRGSFRDFKSRQRDYKSGQGFQIGAKRFQIWAKRLQIGAGISNRGMDYKSVQNSIMYSREKNLKELISPFLFLQPQLATKSRPLVSKCVNI